ncbi:sulfotransferase [Afifella sp. H1R]|uniref:sulfotransferase n=1 Tax=Afifella sp. H1R TaxID=2908841 RepID=UPI001F1752C1|nr:sulfotransferase [Afifella sp. H1R]MCF1504916.1 sulfotransferase [Afifella sp. H1R]
MTARPDFEKFIVIVTYGRSGSTLLQTALQTIPGAMIRGENNNLLYPLFRAWKRAHNTRYNQGQTPIPAHGPWYGADEIVPRRFGEELAGLFVREILKPTPQTRVLGFKEIRFHDAEPGEMPEFLDFIREFFPPCRLIFNTRRAADVARSSWWKDVETEKVMEMVEDLDRQYADYVAAHSDTSFLVRYDDYVKDRASLRALFDFLGEAYDEAAVEAAFGHRLPH